MFLRNHKLEARINEIQGLRYRDKFSLEFLLKQEDTAGLVNPPVPTNFDNWDKIEIGDYWKGRDLYLWLHKKVSIPKEWAGKTIVGLFDYGMTGAGNNSGFESLLYVNEKPYQGVDSNHKEVFFTEDLLSNDINLTFRLWSGLEGGGQPTPQEHAIKQAEIAWLDEKVDDLYYLSDMILQTIKILDEYDPIKGRLTVALDNAFKLIDWREPASEEFYASVHAADDYLNEQIDAMDKNSLVHVKCIGHTHIDVAWLWRLKHTREKCARSFSTVIRLMEKYPDYIFLQTQPQLYEYIKEDYPEIYETIKEKIKSGQWEADGGMWVEADCNLTSGESLTRQILLGSKFIKDEFDKDVEYLWLPDVFGYSWALPQILKKSGIDMFMTTKISWNQYNRMPHDTFKWKGIDGSEIITHFITTPEPWSEPGSWFYTYNGKLLPQMAKGVWDAYSEKDLTDELLISYGYGDGGGGVNRDMLESRRRMDKIPGLPSVKTGTAGEYFANLKEKVENTDQYVHTWDGELYLEYHRGTYTSQAYNKKMNRQLEFFYRDAEWLTAMSAMMTRDLGIANQEDLTEGWKIILRNQFHDIIPGSSIKEVYDDCRVEYDEAWAIADKVEKDSLSKWINKEDNVYTVINSSNWNRTEIIEVEKDQDGRWLDSNANQLSATKQDGIWSVEVKDIPQMGFTTITFEPGSSNKVDAVFSVNGKSIETPFYQVEFNQAGQFTSIWDKENKMQVLADGERGNVLQMFEDKPLAHEAWDIDMFYQEKMREIDEITSFEVVENTNLKLVVRLGWIYGKSTIKQDVVFYANDRNIDFKTWVDWRERKQLMKVAFPVDIRATYATYDVQYGNVRRANHWNTSWDWAKFETVAQKWVDLSERNYGVALLNDCKYGHDIKDNVIRLTLLKAATHPDIEQDQGEHEFTYTLLPHAGDFVDADVVPKSWALNQPCKIIPGISEDKVGSFIEIDNQYVELDAVKKSEDGQYIVLRIHEYTGSKQDVNIKLNSEIAGWMESDLMERPIEDMREEQVISLHVKPFEIKTVLIKL